MKSEKTVAWQQRQHAQRQQGSHASQCAQRGRACIPCCLARRGTRLAPSCRRTMPCRPIEQVAGEADKKLAKRLKYLGERMHLRGNEEEGAPRHRGKGGGLLHARHRYQRWLGCQAARPRNWRSTTQPPSYILMTSTPCRPLPQTGGVFVGYKKYDRRKQHIKELDERAAAILAAQGAVSGAESEGGCTGVCGRGAAAPAAHLAAPCTVSCCQVVSVCTPGRRAWL